MKPSQILMKLMVAALFAGGTALAWGEVPVKKADGALTNSSGMTLYTYDKDVPNSGKSTCNDKCAANWPPLMAQDSAKSEGDYTVVTRDDGKKQWAHKGKPLYLWVKDQKPGDKTGDNVNNVWHVAKP